MGTCGAQIFNWNSPSSVNVLRKSIMLYAADGVLFVIYNIETHLVLTLESEVACSFGLTSGLLQSPC